MDQVLIKNEIIDGEYTVKFFMGADNISQRYRVLDSKGKTVSLTIYNSAKLKKDDFDHEQLLITNILSLFNTGNIDTLIDSGEFAKNLKKFHYVVTKFVSGESLQDKIQRDGVYSQYEAVALTIDILQALSLLHTNDKVICHNNINPSTVILDYSGEVAKPVLTSFIHSRYITSKSHSVNIAELSPFYVAPELYNGIFTPQSDIFAVGALLYQLIFGLPPWYVEIPKYQLTTEKQRDAIALQREKKLTLGILESDDVIDENLKQVLRKALAINVDERFSNVQDFIASLKGKQLSMLSGAKEGINTTAKVETICVGVAKGAGFSLIAGMQELKDILYADVIRALNEPELYKSYGITIPNGMLLYGPPGCGKTFIAERFSEEVGFNFLQLKPSDLKSKWVNDTELKIAGIFKQAEENAPSIIFIDEFDAVVPSREGDLHEMNASAVNELLTHMSNCSERGIFVIAATNRPEKIDSAILRTGRIDRIIYLPPPDYEARMSMFNLYLKDRPTDIGVDYSKLALLTHNYVSSDIKFIVDDASRKALAIRGRITQEILQGVILDTRPSISEQELSKYERLKDQMESR